MRSGLAAASYFLGHKSQVTTERFYATWFQNAEALDGEAVGRALVAEAAQDARDAVIEFGTHDFDQPAG